MSYRIAQDFPKSQSRLGAAEDLANRFQPQMLCEVLNFRGALEVDEQKYDAADATYKRALSLAHQHGRSDQEASAEVSLAWVAMKLEHFDQAIDRGQVALQHSRSLGMQGLVAATLGNLGWSYFQLGDFDAALDFYQQAAQASRQSGLPGYELYWFTGIANSYAALHQYAPATALAQQTLQAARGIGNPEIITECLNDLAEIYLRVGQIDLARQFNEQALDMERKGIDHFGVLDSTLVAGRIAATRDFDLAQELFTRVLQDRNADAPLRWEAEARLAQLHGARGLSSRAEQEYRKAMDTIETARAGIDRTDLRLSYLSGGISFYDDFIAFLIAHDRPNDALQVAELSRARTLAEGLGAAPRSISFPLRNFHPQEIARRSRATLLFYWLGEKASHLWVITPAGVVCLALPAASEIDSLVKSYREAVLNGRDVLEAGNADGKKLYAMLVEPAKKWIPRDSRVILLPDGSLYGLNLETLIVPEPQPHFWIEDVTLSTASSLTLLAASAATPSGGVRSAVRRAQRADADQGRLLLVGNAVSSSADFPPLLQAASEIDQVSHYFVDSRRNVLAGAQATPAAFLQRKPENFAYLHFVTHGTASRSHPLDSAVILSPEGADAGSFKLYAREIVKHRLSAQLVTISACNGSGTRAFSGEGLVGLSWAFLRAGAHNVIAALWEVNDASTPQLMDHLYSELSQGRSPADALRAAKLALLHSDSVFRKPFYWAPFQLYSGS